jgi:transcriptional regulator with XRE-family HTH domain
MNKRKSHFFGIKLRKKRLDSGLTLEDLMNRCVAVDASNAPSISYLSLLETGRRSPTEKLINIFSEVFNEASDWFTDDSTEIDEEDSHLTHEFILEPNVLFDKSILTRAIPNVLTQTGISDRRFAYALISALQDRQKNHFPDLEREAELLGKKKLPMSLDYIFGICTRVGLKVKWFNKEPVKIAVEEAGEEIRSLARSFFQSPNTI